MNTVPYERREAIEKNPSAVFVAEIDALFSRFPDYIKSGTSDPLDFAREGEEFLSLQPSALLQDGDSIIDIFPNLTAITVKRPLPGLENLHLIGGYSVGLSEEKDEKYSTSKYRVDQNDVLKQYKKPQNKNWTSEDYERFIQQQRAKERLADEVVALSALDRAAALRIVKGEVISEGELTTIIHILTSAVPS